MRYRRMTYCGITALCIASRGKEGDQYSQFLSVYSGSRNLYAHNSLLLLLVKVFFLVLSTLLLHTLHTFICQWIGSVGSCQSLVCCNCTTAALLSLVSPGASWTDYNHCSIQQQDDRTAVVSSTVFHHCGAAFTGCVSQNAFNFIRPFLYSTITKDSISGMNYNGQPTMTPEGSYCQHHLKMTVGCVGRDLQRLATGSPHFACRKTCLPLRHPRPIFCQSLKRLKCTCLANHLISGAFCISFVCQKGI